MIRFTVGSSQASLESITLWSASLFTTISSCFVARLSIFTIISCWVASIFFCVLLRLDQVTPSQKTNTRIGIAVFKSNVSLSFSRVCFITGDL
jgi:hypothetical protein